MHKEFEFKNGNGNIWEEWTQFIKIKEFNWLEFHLCQLEFEFDKQLGGLEFCFIVLGFGIWIRFNYETKKSNKEWEKIRKRTSTFKVMSKAKPYWVNEKRWEILNNRKSKEEGIYLWKRKKDVPKPKKVFIYTIEKEKL